MIETDDFPARFLIVNADDFGLSDGVNRGIIEAHERGLVTSTSLMVRPAAAAAAADYARAHPALSVGLHVDLCEWRHDGDEWRLVYAVVDCEDEAAVRAELERQLAAFQALLGRRPAQIDSHQHAHNSEPVRSVMLAAAAKLGVPIRACTPGLGYCGDFYGQSGRGDPFPEGISTAQLVRTIENLPPGWTELGCHPGYGDELDSVYAHERVQEIRALCAPEARAALERASMALCSFHDFAAVHFAAPPLPSSK